MEFILALVFCFSIALNVFLIIDKGEKNQETFDYVNQLEKDKTKAIEFAKTKFKDDKENRELIEKMKDIGVKNRPALKRGKKFIN